MISRAVYEQAIFDAIRKGSTDIAPDVRAAFERAIAKESRAAAKEGLEKTYESIKLSARRGTPACPDTGWPIFYFKAGDQCELKGGFMALEEATRSGGACPPNVLGIGGTANIAGNLAFPFPPSDIKVGPSTCSVCTHCCAVTILQTRSNALMKWLGRAGRVRRPAAHSAGQPHL